MAFAYKLTDETLEKLTALGINSRQINGKIVPALLAVLTDEKNPVDIYKEIESVKENIIKEEEKARALYNENYYKNFEIKKLKEQLENKTKILEEERKQLEEEKKCIWENKFETPEARDRYRLAEYFKESISTNNVYQETEYSELLTTYGISSR